MNIINISFHLVIKEQEIDKNVIERDPEAIGLQDKITFIDPYFDDGYETYSDPTTPSWDGNLRLRYNDRKIEGNSRLSHMFRFKRPKYEFRYR